jgi:ParB-like chromosome segregation protein Spo0J
MLRMLLIKDIKYKERNTKVNEDLLSSIIKNGLIGQITVDEKLNLIDGYERIKCLKKMGVEKALVKIAKYA